MRPLLKVVFATFVAAAAAASAAPPTVGGCQVLPADNYWNTPIDALPLHPSSAAWVNSVGNTHRLHPDWGNVLTDYYGIPFTTSTNATPPVPITGDPGEYYGSESDPGPYPIPALAPIEGIPGATSGDRHLLVINTDTCMLYELFGATRIGGGTSFSAISHAKFDLTSNALRPAGWTSADAAGFPVFAGLVRWEEVAAGEINHAIRFTAANIWGRESASGPRKYLWPARHWSGNSTDATRPPMGARFRLKASFNISSFRPDTQVILRAFKKYGMVLADAGSNWFFSGVSSTSWPDALLNELKSIEGSNFEVVDTASMQINPNSGQAVQPPTDMAVAMTTSPNPGTANKDVVYQITVSNIGSGAASNVTLTDTLPGGASLIWATTGCTGGGTLTCNLGMIGAGASVPVKVVVRPSGAGSLTNNVSVSASSDTNPANSTASSTITVNAAPTATSVQRYRLYSPVTLEHHFTTDLNEYNVLGGFVGTWVQEGTVGKVLNNPGTFNGVTAVPYYRLYDNNTRWHHWTTDANEYYTLITFPGWIGEGVDGWILPTPTAGATQLYRLNYPFLGSLHHWTIDANEYNVLTTSFGWIGEGGAGFVIQ